MSLKLSRRNALKALGLAFCSSVLPKFAWAEEPEWVLGFGSCMSQRRSQGYWQAILARRYDHWAFLGDNLYPDRDDLPSLIEAYQQLAKSEGLAKLRAQTPISATWDDHDFGADNADSSLPFKTESLNLFRNFWTQEYASADDGVYSAREFFHQGKKIHLILLDLRFNRTPHAEIKGAGTWENAATPQLLGDRQWAWFESELAKPADLKVIGSSIQVLSADHNFEKWKNYPEEYDRLISLVSRLSAPTVFLSGDRHFHEISKVQLVSGRTLYDFTSSGLNKADGLSRFERNRLRTTRSLADGFGELRIRWEGNSPRITMQMIDDDGNVRFSQSDVLV